MVRSSLLKREPNRTYIRVFENDPAKLAEMLQRYIKGEPAAVLGRAYGVDHTSIIFQAKKAGVWHTGVQKVPAPRVKPEPAPKPPKVAPEPPKKVYKYQPVFDQKDKKCPGKDYAEYAAEAAARMFAKFQNTGPYPAALLTHRKKVSAGRR